MHAQNSVVSKIARNLFQICYQQQQHRTHLWVQRTLVLQQLQRAHSNGIYRGLGTSTQNKLLQNVQQQQKYQQDHQQQSHVLSKSMQNQLRYYTSCVPSAVNNLIHPTMQTLRSYSKFTVRPTDPPLHLTHPQPLTPERATELVASLKDAELGHIKKAIEKYEATKMKEHFVGKLAATQWRTRFGRPTKVPSLGDVDPTGTFCAFPDDWLKQKAVQNAKEPTRSDLWKLFMVNAVPFIGFGFLDNFTMIIAGDYIEYSLGYFMTMSTMAAAGLGNTISDVLGIGSATYVERLCELMGLRPPDLTAVQMELKSSRRAANYGRIIGITVGCLVGMFPLLFMDKQPSDRVHVPAE